MKRFLIPIGENINLSHFGFLPDPEDKWQKFYNPSIMSFDEIENEPCLIILGEPGIGKTYLLKEEAQKLKLLNKKVVWISLKDISSDIALNEEFAQEEFNNLASSSENLYLFLDGLDEALISFDILAIRLVKKLEKLPKDKLFIRISCRSSVFPLSIKQKLEDLWIVKNKCFEITPLRYKDVEECANNRDIVNIEDFFNKIHQYKISAFANKPLTLETIIELYKSQKLSSKQVDIYYKLCKKLAEELNPNRLELAIINPKYEGYLISDERLYIAGRIFTCLIFSNKSSVFFGKLEELPEFAIPLEELCKGIEVINGKNIELSKEIIREVLGTSLFTLHKDNCIGFAHRSYAEFLAAWYVTTKNIDIESLISLITFPESGGAIVPQVLEVASWLSSQNQEIFARISESDPEILIISSVMDFENKENLVDKLFELTSKKKLSFNYYEHSDKLAKLSYLGLSEKVKNYIKSDNDEIRYLAIEIAEICKLKDLESEIYNIAIDSSEEVRNKKNAFYALISFGSESIKQELSAKYDDFIRDFNNNDPDDELKGCYLRLLWPDYLDLEKVIKLLTKPKNDSLFGAYRNFVKNYLVEGLKKNPDIDIPVMLNCVRNLREEFPTKYYQLSELVMSIYTLTWDYLDNFVIRKSFAETLMIRGKKDYQFFHRADEDNFWHRLKEDHNKRQKLIKTFIYDLNLNEDQLIDFTRLSSIIRNNDIPYLMLLYKDESNLLIKEKLKFVINDFGPYPIWRNISTYKDIDELNKLFMEYPVLNKTFGYFINEVELDPNNNYEPKDPNYKKTKDYYYKYEAKEYTKPQESIDVKDRIELCLSKIESGNLNYWFNLLQELTLTPTSTHYDNPDLVVKDNPGWNECDETTQQRIISATLRFLECSDSNQFENYLNTNQHSYGWYAIGYIPLIKDIIDSERFKNIIKRWIGPILLLPSFNNDESEKLKKELSCYSFNLNPKETLDIIFKILKVQTDSTSDYILELFESCWDNNLSEKLFEFLSMTSEISSKNQCYIIKHLLIHGFIKVKEFAKTLTENELNKVEDKNEEFIIKLTEILAFYTDDSCWDFLWPIIKGNDGLGLKILEHIAHDEFYYKKTLVTKLKQKELADLYIWIEQKFPIAEEKRPQGAHWISPEESLRNLRSDILNYLVNNGLIEGFQEIIKINPNKIANEDWFNFNFLKAKRNYYKTNWLSNNLNEILELINNSDKRLINSSDALFRLVLEKLKLIETKFHGETAAVARLWNTSPQIKPKEENEFSDEIKRCLYEELVNKKVIINREAEVKRGEETDIKIDMPTEVGKISIIIEAKGCWHKDLKESIETQLYNRYLKNTECDLGIYLIGWFYCEKWNNKDYRKSKSFSIFRTTEEMSDYFNKKDIELSKNDKIIKTFIFDATLS